jgi:hypothetical protein
VGAASAAEVSGELRVPETFARRPAPEAHAFYWQVDNGLVPTRTLPFDPASEVSVVLTGEGEAPADLTLRIANGGLYPSTLAVRAGAPFRLRNDDAMRHAVFAEGVEGFHPRAVSPGDVRELTVAEAGVHALRDERYPHVHGSLHVLPDLRYVGTVTGSAYRFEDVDEGRYTLLVLYGEGRVGETSVQVGERGTVTVPPIRLRR